MRALETALAEQRASGDMQQASLERAYTATKLSERQLREQLQEQVTETARLEAENERLAGEAKRWRADLGLLEAQLHGAAEATIAKLREELHSMHGRCERAELQAALLPSATHEARAEEASRAQSYWMEQQRSVQRELEQQQEQQQHAVAVMRDEHMAELRSRMRQIDELQRQLEEREREQRTLRRFVVHGRDVEQLRGARRLRLQRHRDGLCGVIGARTGDHGDAPTHLLAPCAGGPTLARSTRI